MADLDLWSEANVVGPLIEAAPAAQQPDSAEWEEAVEVVKQSIRAKVLESYRNAQKATDRPEQPVRGNGGLYGR